MFIPAIGADPRVTWKQTEQNDKPQRLDAAILKRLKPEAQVYLYDHLETRERSLELPKAEEVPLTQEQQQAINAFEEARNGVARFGIKDWAERLLKCLTEYRERETQANRPIIFICHSTGGNVLKRALTWKTDGKLNKIASNTIAISFFGVPHHGSTVLSGDEYVQSVQTHLKTKWKMSPKLRKDFQLRDKNEDLEMLNHDFAVDMIGIKIHSYAEMVDTHLDVLTSSETFGGEGTAIISLCIVDSRSARLGTPQAPVEDEQFIQLDANHQHLPRFQGAHLDEQHVIYLDEIERLVTGHNESARLAYQTLKTKIMTETKVYVHQFYGNRNAKNSSMKILLTKPNLERFLTLGPAKVMTDRIEGHDEEVRVSVDRPHFDLHPASEQAISTIHPDVPTFKIDAMESNSKTDQDANSPPSKLAPPAIPFPKTLHTPRPPRTNIVSQESPQGLGPSPNRSALSKSVGFIGEPMDRDLIKEPQRAAAFLLPSQAPDRFKWIHVPFTNAGWVHHILGRISKEKNDLNLHHHLLKDQMWFNQHNQSRHASPHALFVRPCVKGLTTVGSEIKHSRTDVSAMDPGIHDDIQLVAYMPYLHWDSYVNMKKRADIIKRRTDQASPIPCDILDGKSTEHR